MGQRRINLRTSMKRQAYSRTNLVLGTARVLIFYWVRELADSVLA